MRNRGPRDRNRFGRDRAWDCAVLAEIRAALGSKVDLMIDAGRVWSL